MQNSSTQSFHYQSLTKVLTYIDEHLQEQLELDVLAKIACISPYYFHRLFRIHVGETLADYIKRLRLQKAEEQLQHSKDSITEIAYDAGYETLSSFIKVFNQEKGISPKKYREQVHPFALEQPRGAKMPKAIYLHRADEEVLFVRKTGDYNETPDGAFVALKGFLQEEGISPETIKAFYGTALDDHYIVDRIKCRFEACVALTRTPLGKGEVGRKILRGGRYVVFENYGPGTPPSLEEAMDDILRYWYPSLKGESLGHSPPFFEFVYCLDKSSSPADKRLTRIYIPLQKESHAT